VVVLKNSTLTEFVAGLDSLAAVAVGNFQKILQARPYLVTNNVTVCTESARRLGSELLFIYFLNKVT